MPTTAPMTPKITQVCVAEFLKGAELGGTIGFRTTHEYGFYSPVLDIDLTQHALKLTLNADECKPYDPATGKGFIKKGLVWTRFGEGDGFVEIRRILRDGEIKLVKEWDIWFDKYLNSEPGVAVSVCSYRYPAANTSYPTSLK